MVVCVRSPVRREENRPAVGVVWGVAAAARGERNTGLWESIDRWNSLSLSWPLLYRAPGLFPLDITARVDLKFV